MKKSTYPVVHLFVMDSVRDEAMTEALEAYGIKRGLILTYDQEESIQHKGHKVIVMPVWKWLLATKTSD